MRLDPPITIDPKNRSKHIETIIREQETIATYLQKMRPGRFTIHDIFGSNEFNEQKLFYVCLDAPLFYDESEFYPSKSITCFCSAEYSLAPSVESSSRFEIEFEHLSDPETQDQWEKLPTGIRDKYYPETKLYFEKPGLVKKIITLPEPLKTARTEVAPQTRMFESSVTEQDIIYSERLVTLIRRRLDDFYEVREQHHLIET